MCVNSLWFIKEKGGLKMKYAEFLRKAEIYILGSCRNWICPICPKRKQIPLFTHRGNHFVKYHTRKWKTLEALK